jgi:hypothetical protein
MRSLDRHELPLPTWTAAQAEDWLGRWAINRRASSGVLCGYPTVLCRSLPGAELYFHRGPSRVEYRAGAVFLLLR